SEEKAWGGWPGRTGALVVVRDLKVVGIAGSNGVTLPQQRGDRQHRRGDGGAIVDACLDAVKAGPAVQPAQGGAQRDIDDIVQVAACGHAAWRQYAHDAK